MATSDGGAGLATWLIHRRRLVWAAWLVAGAALLPLARTAEQRLDVAARVEGSGSALVQEILAERFDSPFAVHAILIATGLPSPTGDDGRALLERVSREMGAIDGVTGTLSHLDAADSMLVGSGGNGAVLVVGLAPASGRADDMIPVLREATRRLEAELRLDHPAATLMWTGELALNFDLRRSSASDAGRAERLVLPLTLVLLVLAFGAVVAALLPVMSGALAISIALGSAVAVHELIPLSILLQNVITMLGLGLGIDYALLMVSRFREARASGLDPEAAAAEACRRAGHTIVWSGSTVAIGFAALLIVPVGELRSIGIGGLLVTITAILLATTLLPATLAALGAHVNAGTVLQGRSAGRPGRHWRAWAGVVNAHPVLVLAAGCALLLPLVAQAGRLGTSLPRGDWLPPAMESAGGLRALQVMRRGGLIQVVRVVVELPAGTAAASPAGWEAVRRLGDRLAADPRVARARSLPSVTSIAVPHPLLVSFIPPAVLRTYASRDGSLALIEVVPEEDVEPAAMAALVGELRRADGEQWTGLRGARLLVGGLPAFNADYDSAIAGWLPAVVALVLGATFIALLAACRSLLISLKAVVLNLLSVGGAIGAMVLVFQDGHGAGLFGAAGATGGVFPAVPILVFCIVFGLSMDYEVFLISRVREARRRGASEPEALAEGLERTGGVITSAAAVMVVVFAAFTLAEFLLIKMLGFALATAVLLDATIVRVAVGPALLRLAGEWNWWPDKARVVAGLGAAGWSVGRRSARVQGVRVVEPPFNDSDPLEPLEQRLELRPGSDGW
ncbi:MAG TPA: MMPL family transporter [Gemmatimonadaceae bacterium]|nr:MMPL family transporter [Gemmatimonadaceae bacterium]